MNWRKRAACRTEDPELFFPTYSRRCADQQLAEAKAICRRCPVTTACLEWALSNDEKRGVWGGLSESELRKLKRISVRLDIV
ncbi:MULTISPECIES: WhiB family transcriptional regulator [unclassified Streptomyces]|uniref:WhiB family transcriptional regulator n=1 Tax=unclassified Streptomyces TaxID=2593676 RepID=UPI003410B0AE